ncbi:MAG: hypothetical protein HXY40_16980 [Chloroflexi bacterium]|nr:hypothetical protein [Chloroflexota bacterium]
MAANIFRIQHAQEYVCHVHRYYSGLSRLYVRAFKGRAPEPAFYLLFSDVSYFEGPLNWQGAGFRKAAAADCHALMQRAGLLDNVPREMLPTLLEVTHLYLLDSAPLRIVAGHAVRLTQIPPEL